MSPMDHPNGRHINVRIWRYVYLRTNVRDVPRYYNQQYGANKLRQKKSDSSSTFVVSTKVGSFRPSRPPLVILLNIYY